MPNDPLLDPSWLQSSKMKIGGIEYTLKSIYCSGVSDSPRLIAIRRFREMGLSWKRIQEVVGTMEKAGVFNAQ